MSRTAPNTLESSLRRFTGFAMVAAASIRSRTPRTPVTPAPVPRIATTPTKVAEQGLRDAFAALKEADPGATEAQLFRQLRLMMNRLENGGMRGAGASTTLSRAPKPSPADVAQVPVRRRDQLLSRLRDRSRTLGRALLGS